MSEEQDPKSGGRFLSKVVKFISSPTTDWADLNKVGGRADAGASSAALKEMIERKRRNDFVRNREFDMLRKARRRQLAGLAGGGTAPTSYISNVESVHAPERTLEKIDRIEEQMARGWLGPQDSQAPQTPGHAYDRTRPVDLGSGRAGGVARHFAPTVVESNLAAAAPHASADTEPDDLVAMPPAPAAEAHVLPEPVPVHVSPEVEEVAIRFANGDAAGAEASLLELLGDRGGLGEDAETWLTLFDLYRAAGEPDKFDGAAIAFAGRFGRSAPQWDLVASVGSGPMPMMGAPTARAPASADGLLVVHWTAPAAIGTQSMAALNAQLARQAPPWRVDWRRLRTIEPAALPALLDVLQRWADMPVRLRFLGVDQLLDVLAVQAPTEQREVDPQWWAAHLAALRVVNEPDEFELVALNYCVTYEMSPPPWEEPRCEWAPLADSGHTLAPPDVDAPDEARHSERYSDVMPLAVASPDAAQLALEGELLGDAGAALQPLSLTTRTRLIEFNCRHLRRVDFGAAGDLLNWTVQQQGQGRQVVFRHVNRLVAAFFGVIGISDSARVLRRVD